MPERIIIIIPCFNEDNALRTTVEAALSADAQVVVVDDGSRTEQAQFLQGLPVTILRHPLNLGQGAALQTGMEVAKSMDADIAVHFDADGQHDIADLPRFIDAIHNGADVAIGSRFLRRQDAMLVPRGKRLLLRMARIVNGIFTGMWLTDAHNGYRALNKKALAAIDLHENRMAHATEILSQIHKAGLNLKEIPVTINYTDYSRAKGQKWTNSLNILIDLMLDKIM